MHTVEARFPKIAFDPVLSASDSEMHDMREWALPASLADRLNTVIVDFEGITELRHTADYLRLFGNANRPDVLRVRAGATRLC
jgi:hypothetical protein